MAALEIRRFESGDGEAVRRIDERAMSTTPEWVPEVPDADLRDVPGHYFGDGEFIVGLLDGEIVATAAYEPLAGWMADEFPALAGDGDGGPGVEGERGGPAVELSRMRVDPDHWGRGVGTRISAELERRARPDGYRAFVLNTGVDNERARDFYEGRGFEHVRDVDVTFEDVTMHLSLYRKPLAVSRPAVGNA